MFRLSTTTPKARRSKQVLESSPETEDEISEGNDTNIPSTAIIESDQRMSKEKQKFFRLSAFNPEKRKRNKDAVLATLDSSDNVALRIGRNNNKCALSSDSDSSDDERLPSPSKSVPSATVPKPPAPTLQTLIQDTKFNVPRSNFKLADSASLKKCDKLLIPRKVSTSSWSSESSCDESSDSCSSASSRLSSPRSSPLSKPLAAVTYNTTFHRLGAAGGDKWGFAAEAQKECSLVPRKLESANLQLPALPALTTAAADILTSRTFGSFQAQPRNRDRLLTTLFDGLSEFYAVRHGCRVRSSSKVEQTIAERLPPPAPYREVLKETRSTLKNLNDSLKSADNSPSKQTELNNDSLQYKLVPTKDEYLRRAPAPGLYSLKENEVVISQDPADLRCDSTPPGALEDRIDMCPSALVKAAVYAKRHEFGRSDMLKTFNHLKFGMSDSPSLEGHKYLGWGLGSDYNLPTTFELRKQQLIADVSTIKSPLTLVQPSTNRTGKDSSSATRSFTFPPHSIPQAL